MRLRSLIIARPAWSMIVTVPPYPGLIPLTCGKIINLIKKYKNVELDFKNPTELN